jgi:hypothetical protein
LKERCFDVFLERNKRTGHGEKYNYELYETFNEPNIVNYIKVKRLAWAGHLVRTNNNRTLKKILSTKPDGVRNVGRSKLRWEDGVDQDVRILFSWRYNPLWLYFHSPVAGFSLLVFEVF